MNETLLLAVLASSGLWAVILRVVDYAIEKRKGNTVEQNALGALIRHDMFEIYDTFKEADTVPHAIQEEMDSLYQAYHALGYNNMGTKIHDEIMRKTTEV